MRIEKYKKDRVITPDDMVLGTDGNDLNKTKNFPIWQLSQVIQGLIKATGLVMRYSDGSDPDYTIGSPGHFFTDQNIIDKSQITSFYFSKTTLFGEDISALFNSVGNNLGELYINITQQDDAANYGIYDITDVERIEGYYRVDVSVVRSLFSKTLKTSKNYSLLFGLANDDVDKSFIYEQSIPSDTWTIEHPLEKYPSITVLDSTGRKVAGEEEHVNENKVIIRFNGGFSGKAILN